MSRCPGKLLKMTFCIRKRVFMLRYKHDRVSSGPLVVFVPFFQYQAPPLVTVSDGHYTLNRQKQELLFFHDSGKMEFHEIKIFPASS